MADLTGTTLDGKYELARKLGEGGMGTVYEATHKLIGRRLAVKFLRAQYITSQEVVTRFQREAQAAAAIGHENIIEVTDMGTGPDEAPYIVMEYLDGNDVKQILSTEILLPPERAAHIMVQALSALKAAHQAGIIHRDLKPENIYLIDKPDRPDYVKLLDFGISKFKSLEAEGAKNLTQTGTVLGTPYYMSPEQARGDQNLTNRSDIYAMGVILYQMLTGKLPFDAANYNALLIKILTEDPIPPEELNPDIPPELVDTIKIAMAREATDRFADCAEFKAQLMPFVPGTTGIRMETVLSPASRTAVRAALSTTNDTPLEMTSTGIMTGKRKTPLLIAASAASGLALIGILLLSGVFDDDDAAVTTAVPVAIPTDGEIVENSADAASEQSTEPKEINLKISVSPTSAVIEIDGEKVEGNPFEGAFPKDDSVHTLAISADGFKTETTELKFEENQILSFTLSESNNTEESKSRRSRRSSKRRRKSSNSSSDSTGKPTKKPRRKIDDADPWS